MFQRRIQWRRVFSALAEGCFMWGLWTCFAVFTVAPFLFYYGTNRIQVMYFFVCVASGLGIATVCTVTEYKSDRIEKSNGELALFFGLLNPVAAPLFIPVWGAMYIGIRVPERPVHIRKRLY